MRFALLGEKLSHSYSKIIHEKIYNKIGIDASYSLYELSIEDLPIALDELKKGIYNGFNVTIPYKKEIMKYLDYIEPEAKKIGSVNTISYKNGKLIGSNTDYYGFIDELNYYNINPSNKDCYILGTGGASLAVAQALKDLGGNVIYVSRNKTNKSNTIDYSDLKQINKIDLLVNTTPVGMYPNIDKSPIGSGYNIDTVVDIIFNPKYTKLLKEYNSTYNGLLMLVSQALKSDCIWLNRKINLDIAKINQEIEEIVYE